MNKHKAGRLMLEFFTILLTLIILVPLYFVVVNSFKTSNDAADMLLSWPSTFQIIENYTKVIIEGNILRSFANSTVITVMSVAIIVVITSMAGFVLQRRTSRFLDLVILSGLIVPPAMVPTYWVFKLLHMNSSFQGVILLFSALGFSFSTILYKGFFSTVPRELDEAAIVDGCGRLRLFFYIVLPILKPVTVTIIIVQVVTVWNDFTIPLYFLSSYEKMTLPMTVYLFFGKFSSSWNLVFADVVIIALPVLIIYLAAQKYIIAGMTAGAIKG